MLSGVYKRQHNDRQPLILSFKWKCKQNYVKNCEQIRSDFDLHWEHTAVQDDRFIFVNEIWQCLPIWLQMPYNEYCTDVELAAYGAIFNSRSPVGNSTMFVNLLQRVSENRFKSEIQFSSIQLIQLRFPFNGWEWDEIRAKKHLRMAKYFGNRWMVKLLVDFRRVLHFAQVGISSPSSTSSLINKSKQLSSLHRLDVGNGTLKIKRKSLEFSIILWQTKVWATSTFFLLSNCFFSFHFALNNVYLKSQNGSNVTLVLPHTVHFNELFNWPTNKSLTTEFSTFEYHSHVRSAFTLFDRFSSISNFSPFVPAFNAQCNASKKNRKNSCASCCEQPLYMRCFDENANFNSLGVTDVFVPFHISLMSLENSVTIRESLAAVVERKSNFVRR